MTRPKINLLNNLHNVAQVCHNLITGKRKEQKLEKIEAGLYEYKGYTIYNAATYYLAPSGWVARNHYQELWAATLKELKQLIS